MIFIVFERFGLISFGKNVPNSFFWGGSPLFLFLIFFIGVKKYAWVRSLILKKDRQYEEISYWVNFLIILLGLMSFGFMLSFIVQKQ
jgi:hypothetical protein